MVLTLILRVSDTLCKFCAFVRKITRTEHTKNTENFGVKVRADIGYRFLIE